MRQWLPSTWLISGYKGRVSYADFFYCNQLLHNLESSLLGEQCMADSISNGSESEEVAD